MSDNRCKVIVTTYSWAQCKAPRVDSCHVIESPKKLTFRVSYKFNHRSAIFALYVILPVERYFIEYNDETVYEIDGGPNSWGWAYRYPRTSFDVCGHHTFICDADILLEEFDTI